MRIPRRYDARIVVGLPKGPYSSPWSIWRTNNEIYVASSKSGGIEKLSFHSGGACRKAFTSEHGTPPQLPTRAISEWRRSDLPARGMNGGSCVFEVGIPTDYLSSVLAPQDKPIIWVEPAPSRMATVLSMFFTVEPEALMRTLISQSNRTVRVFTELPNSEAFVVTSHHATFAAENFIVPASHHENQDYVVSADDPNNTGRPARLTMFSNPKDGDALRAWEYGAYKAPKGAVKGERFGTFDRNSVLYRTSGG
jgi:hypothetical protein